MERKLSDKERFIIQVAVNRSAENHFDRQKGWKRVKRCTNNGYIIRRRHSWLAICVSALCLLSGSGYLFIRHFAVYPPAISPSPEIYKADGIPVLTLENGEQIFLNPNQSPLIRPQTAANLQLDSIVQSIRYLPTETPGYDSTLSYHSLEIPKGGEYRLQLADGSRIWLNSESSLRYPVKFGLHRREIFLRRDLSGSSTRYPTPFHRTHRQPDYKSFRNPVQRSQLSDRQSLEYDFSRRENTNRP